MQTIPEILTMSFDKKFDSEEIVSSEDGTVAVIVTPQTHNQIDIYVTGGIGAPRDYLSVYHTLASASKDDIVYIHFNSEGGNSGTAIQFRHAIQNCPAMVVGVVQGNCMSAASMILLACDSFVVADFSVLLCHNYRGFLSGKGDEMFDQVTFMQKWCENMIREIYAGFLSDDEIDQIMNGKDIWMDHTETRNRLESFVEYRENRVREGDEVKT